jgi:predicted transcriptional regulator
MNLDVASAGPHDSIGRVARLMLDNEIRHVPIVADGAVVRVVSERDILRALLDDEGTNQ